jgi:hypothetical protein
VKRCCLLVFLLTKLAVCQAPAHECIAFSPSDSSSSMLAKDPLSTAVTLSGDFDFYPSSHLGCWEVNVIALEATTQDGLRVGYAVSYTITNPSGVELDFALRFGPDQAVIERAMRDAAADTIKHIRVIRKVNPKN